MQDSDDPFDVASTIILLGARKLFFWGLGVTTIFCVRLGSFLPFVIGEIGELRDRPVA
jgi:hypothetical protein